ncbi:50S ribosomal protein L11 methyltransferase [Parvibaculum sp.]|jgi:ribosomal protein L11 methyltransferase|uniref:50S ribosomal protein L11 methyltransferase n=1 Tax=Parvibaculum sp. TaxID=2024848 RepID=UPI001B0010F3|nr:50S ribosomal protein L11 methyltransferase [Parvibaculum sp.]MBO6633263.1 50S ribosomal protein L11 methyltransferase [Parvibaculum sp.]MBO6679756.1 50S ribosomal protein L11 methyltransferase [Parvibaculum sp.]MBO6683582.1 50S ribosomal protein L11 methyltransferase [Parvibaculum sp.]MBO6903890.1 50S ribosomal protein L11 methyltransferase [Parvibaculum sp.]
MTTLWKLSFVVPYEAAEVFSDALEAAIWPEVLAVTTTEAEPGSSPLVKTASEWNEVEAHGIWRVEALYSERPDETALHEILARVDAAAVPDFAVDPVPDEDWVARSLEGLEPVRAGRFFVYGSHDAEKVPSGTIPLLVDAGQAFGTGHHETTAGCLEFISEMLRPGVPLNALDIGTGTGVLAIAIAKLARVNVLASDIDPVAVRVTKANARANGVAPFITALPAKGFGHPALAARAPYDLIVANILARPLVSLAPAFAKHLKPGGTLILSGTLRAQENMVAGAMRMQGLKLVSRKPKGDWVTLRMQG